MTQSESLMLQKPLKYISNKDLLAEIGRSKSSFCYFTAPEYSIFDVVVPSIDLLTPELLKNTIIAKAVKLSSKSHTVDPASIDPASIVFRVMTDTHLPPETDEKKRKKSSTGEWVSKPNFPPFKHYIITDEQPVEVGRSHWRDGLHNGSFSIIHGKISNRLAQMFMMLAEQYSHRGNWRNYSYRDEFVAHALMHLSQVGLQFDEARSSNPFSFFTQVTKHCFTRVLNLEKRNQNIRDDLLIMAGAMPSFTKQIDNEFEQRDSYDKIDGADTEEVKKVPAKRGRKPKLKAD
jgi:hypothetical protein